MRIVALNCGTRLSVAITYHFAFSRRFQKTATLVIKLLVYFTVKLVICFSLL
mgnify:CR=1 FL=1